MKRLRRMLIRLAGSAARRQDEHRLREEIEDYIDRQTDENLRAGLSPLEARRRALLKFGSIEAVKERYRDAERLPFLETLFRDVRQTVRQLHRAPLFTITATLSLAVGIGGTAAVFTIVDRVLLRSLPVVNPDQLVFVTDQRSRQQPSPRFSYPFFTSLRDNDVLSGVTARYTMAMNAAWGQQATRVRAELVSGSYFDVLGVGTQIGRPFSVEDDRSPGSHPVTVIGHGLWQRSFAADHGVVGRAIRLNNHTFTIVGVAVSTFTGTELGAPIDVWVPMAMQREVGRNLLKETRTNWIEIIGRMKPGMSLERVADELTAHLDRRGQPGLQPAAGHQIVLQPAAQASSSARRALGPALRTLMVLTMLALVLACINVAGLLLVRSIAREKEMAVRLALGARPVSLVQQLLTEAVMLAGVGGIAGLLVAPWAARVLVSSQPESAAIDVTFDMRVFGFGLAMSLVTALLVAVAPILASRRVGLFQLCGSYSKATRAHGRPTLRDLIVAGQIAVSIVVLIGAALFVQSLRNLASIDTGFQAPNVLLMSVDPASGGYDASRIENFWREALERLGQVPGVQIASLAGTVPLAPGRQRQPVLNASAGQVVEIDTNFVGPRYFRTLGIAVLQGREFGDEDTRASAPVVIVNESMARAFFPGQDPIGRTIRSGRPQGPLPQIVGVVSDVTYRDLREAPVPMLYVPARQSRSSDAMTFHIRTVNDPGALVATIRRELQQLAPNLAPFSVMTLEERLHVFLAQPRQAAMLTTAFGVVALLLSGIGVYGVTALASRRHTHDIGIRMALGARPADIVRVIGRRGVLIVIAGLSAGLLGSLAFGRVAGALLFGITPTDAATFASMSLLLGVVSLTAISIPARAATRLDALAAIRTD